MKKPVPGKPQPAAKSTKGLTPDKGDVMVKGKPFEPMKKGGKK